MAMSEARKQANKKWNDANMKERYDRIQLVVAKGRKEQIQAVAKVNGESVNALLNRLIDAEIGRMGGTDKLDTDSIGMAADTHDALNQGGKR